MAENEFNQYIENYNEQNPHEKISNVEILDISPVMTNILELQ
jgi:hypothetical protein